MIFETPRPLSASKLWALQRRYFEREDLRAWSTGTVPHYVTSNAVLADAYARVVVAAILDGRAVLDRDAPLYLVELGAGSGRLGYLFVRRFATLLEDAGLRDLRWCYVLTDFTEASVARWLAHPQLQTHFEAGHLDVARFDAGTDEHLELRRSGARIAPGLLRNPLVVLANYVFDSIPIDLFSIKDGVMQELTVGLELEGVDDAPTDPDDPALLERIKVRFVPRPLAASPYDDPELDSLLASYRDRLTDTTLRFPSGPLRLCRALRRIADDRLLLLSTDKGTIELARLDGQSPPHPALHGSFSYNVNYHAIGQYFDEAGAVVLTPDHAHTSVAIVVIHLDARVPERAALRLAYRTAIGEVGPDDFYLLRRAVETVFDSLPIDGLLTYLRHGRGEPKQLQNALSAIRKTLVDATPQHKADLLALMDAAWANYFHIGEARCFAFTTGVLYCDLGRYPQAIERFLQSVRWGYAGPEVQYNLALCHRRLGDFAKTREHARAALAIDATHTGARNLLDNLPLVEE